MNNQINLIDGLNTSQILVGLDLGTKTIGVAVSDKLKIIASPITTIERKGIKKDLLRLKEVLIEMIFQLGIKKTLKFKKFNFYLKSSKPHLAALEMINSLWYLQTPKRVDNLIKILLSNKNEKR